MEENIVKSRTYKEDEISVEKEKKKDVMARILSSNCGANRANLMGKNISKILGGLELNILLRNYKYIIQLTLCVLEDCKDCLNI